jgi:hypothetical protein
VVISRDVFFYEKKNYIAAYSARKEISVKKLQQQ